MGDKILLTVDELLEATNAYLYSEAFCAGFVSVATDSRNVGNKSLFVPLVGEFQDGHSYIELACKNGADIVLIQKTSIVDYASVYDTLTQNKITLIVVENTLHALQKAAAAYIKKFPSIKKIAITGSNGKTTAKECIASVLSQKYSIIKNVGNLNSETGLPLSVFTITDEHEIGIFEMGTNRRGEIKELADVFFPDIAIITNIGTAHIGILGTQQAIAEEKKQVFSNFNKNSVGYIFENESYSDELKKDVAGTIKMFGEHTTNGIESIVTKGIFGSSIYYEGIEIAFPLLGSHNVQNALVSISIAQDFGLSKQEIKKGLESIEPLFGRSQMLLGNPTIIQDCYNGSFESMNASLEFFQSLDWDGKKIAFLGDMLELGEQSAPIHAKIVENIVESNAHIVVLVGAAFFTAYKTYGKNTSKIVFCSEKIDDDSIANVCDALFSHISDEDIVLFKGSRGIKLERAIKLIQKQYDKEAV